MGARAVVKGSDVDARKRSGVLERRLSAAGWAIAACGLAAALAWIGLQEFGWNDYEKEAEGAVQALVHGHLTSFFALSPAYGGSLLARAPFAVVASSLGGGALAVYRSLAVPCLLAAIALALWLVKSMGQDGKPFASRALVLVLCCANPLTLLALEIGHPDALLGGVLCVAAVLLAARDRWALAGLALGVAIANKPWALIAIGPVLIALPANRARCLAVAGSACGALIAPFLLFAPHSFIHASQLAATSTGTIFQPWQLWWFLGHVAPTGAEVQTTLAGADRIPPSWVITISHPLIVALVVPLTALLWRRLPRLSARRPAGARAGRATTGSRSAIMAAPRGLARWLEEHRRGPAAETDAMLLLCLLLLLRCMLDPWDNVYYPIPFVLALLVWETLRRRPPVLAAAVTVAVLLNHAWMAIVATPDEQAFAFAAWTLPLAAFLAFRLFGGRTRGGRAADALHAAGDAPSAGPDLDPRSPAPRLDPHSPPPLPVCSHDGGVSRPLSSPSAAS